MGEEDSPPRPGDAVGHELCGEREAPRTTDKNSAPGHSSDTYVEISDLDVVRDTYAAKPKPTAEVNNSKFVFKNSLSESKNYPDKIYTWQEKQMSGYQGVGGNNNVTMETLGTCVKYDAVTMGLKYDNANKGVKYDSIAISNTAVLSSGC